MQAETIDDAPLTREKSNTLPTPDPIVSGHSGGDVNDIGDNTTSKLTIAEYNEKVNIGTFEVSETPGFADSDNDDADIDHVQSEYSLSTGFTSFNNV